MLTIDIKQGPLLRTCEILTYEQSIRVDHIARYCARILRRSKAFDVRQLSQ